MPATQRIYYIDSYLTKVESRVVTASDDGLRVTLDRTHFYPTSGGQPHDLGLLNGIDVLDVVDDGETITHVLATPLRETIVQGEIAWPRRYDHMQQHTGQHLLSAVFEELFQIPTLSFRMGETESSIELATKELSAQQIEAAIMRATELARANPSIVITMEDAAEAQGLRKASERAGTLRIVEIPGVDRSACGGTHVSHLAEVLPLQIREQEHARGNVRISFVCGNHSMKRTQADFETLSRVAVALAVSVDKVEFRVLALKQNLAESVKARQHLETEAATRSGFDLYAKTIPGENGIRRMSLCEMIIDENVRTKAKAYTSQPKAVLLMHSQETLLLACSSDSNLNAGALLKQALAKYGARGGGSPTMAQGTLLDQAILHDLKDAIGLPAQ